MLLAGVLCVLIFYIAVMAVGIWASDKMQVINEESVILAGRQLGIVVGVITLVASYVGADLVSSIPEITHSHGLLWCLLPVGYSLAFLLGGLFFAGPIRSAGYMTLLDLFQESYGGKLGALLFVPAAAADITWSAAILSSLGSCLSTVLRLSAPLSVVGCAVFMASYTMLGGLYSVAYTDIIQLLCILLGLILSTPFVWTHTAAWQTPVSISPTHWLGDVDGSNCGEWLDKLLLLSLGSIASQKYFQRILASRSVAAAKVVSFAAAFFCLLTCIPSALIGIVTRNTDWDLVNAFARNVTEQHPDFILSYAIRYLTPQWVSFIGLGAVSAAAMSSADSSFLDATTLFSRNIYHVLCRPKATYYEVWWILRLMLVITASLTAYLALNVDNIYSIYMLCSELAYILIFPQLLITVHWRRKSHYIGYICSILTGFTLRLAFGEPDAGLPRWIHISYGYYLLPYRTAVMLVTLLVHLHVAQLVKYATLERNTLATA